MSGTLTNLVSGLSYLVAGSGMNITSGGNGQVVLAVSPGANVGADPNATYVVMGATGSLANERVLAGGTGVQVTDGGAGGNATLSVHSSVVATVSGTTFTGLTVHTAGVSGSVADAPTVRGTVLTASDYIAVGPARASTGSIRLSNLGGMYTRNFANTVDYRVFNVDGSNNFLLGDSSISDANSDLRCGINAAIRLVVNNTISARFQGEPASPIIDAAATTLTVGAPQSTFNGNIIVAGDTRELRAGIVTASNYVSVGSGPANTGSLRLPNSGSVEFRNAANNANISAVRSHPNNSLAFGDAGHRSVISGSYLLISPAISASMQVASTDRIAVDGAGIGFYNVAPAPRPTISGSRGTNAALGSLLHLLQHFGLIVDSTTA